MCAVSNMGDIGRGMWPPTVPAPWYHANPYLANTNPYPANTIQYPIPYPIPRSGDVPDQSAVKTFPTKAQFEAFDALLRAAMKFDEATGQKECETAAKTAWIKGFYEHFGMGCPL